MAYSLLEHHSLLGRGRAILCWESQSESDLTWSFPSHPPPPQPGPGACASHPGMRASEASSDSCPPSPGSAGVYSGRCVCTHHICDNFNWGDHVQRAPGTADLCHVDPHSGPLDALAANSLEAPSALFLGAQTPRFLGRGEGPSLSLQDGGQHSWGSAGRRRHPTSQNQWVGREVKHLHFHHREKILFPRLCGNLVNFGKL